MKTLDEISDHALLNLLKRKIAKNPGDIKRMRSTLYCGSRVLKPGKGYEPGVFILANNETARFWGTITCKNPWICPVCSARQMSKYATDVAAAIDALKERGQAAFMITFTVPHTSGMPCDETTEILFQTWSDFHVRGNHNLKTKGKTNDWNHADPFATFCQTFNCIHRIRVGEFTWGKHGWHPHFHCLFFVDADKLDLIKGWADTLNERWLELAKRKTIKVWTKRYHNKKNCTKRAEIMFAKADKIGSKGAYISVDKKGNVIRQESSMYICGWGADKELTGNYKMKATGDGHLTPTQILQNAQAAEDDEIEERWLNLYMEFARTIKLVNRRRISFGNSGLRKIIDEYKLSEGYQETIKKKFTQQAANVGKWRIVCWFSESQWLKICLLDRQLNVKHTILQLALYKGRDAVKNYLREFCEIHLIERENLSQDICKKIWGVEAA